MSKPFDTYTKYKREISRLLAEIVKELAHVKANREWVNMAVGQLAVVIHSNPKFKERLDLEMSRKIPLTWPV